MTFFQAIILGIVEGITEFLPVSSTGHMILAGHILSIPQTEFVKSFEIAIQLGAIGAIVFLYWRTILTNRELWKKISVAFIPTALIGFATYRIVKTYLLGNPVIVVVSLVVGGIVFIIIEKTMNKKATISHYASLTYTKSFLIGIGQAVSIIPGVSRSGASIVTGILAGMDRGLAAEFSFLLAIPTMAAATGLDIIKTEWQFSRPEFVMLGIGCLTAFLVAIVTVKYFVVFVRTHTFVPFGIYRIVAAFAFWVLFLRP